MTKGTPNVCINETLANGLLTNYGFNDWSLVDLSWNGRILETKLEKTDKAGEQAGLHLKQKLFMIESKARNLLL